VSIDWRAVAVGAAVALVVAVPAAVIGEVTIGDDPPDDQSSAVFLVTALVLLGCFLGGFVAGSKRPDAPLTHGALAALTAYLLVQGIGAVIVAARGDDLSLVGTAFKALLTASVGLLGGLLANRRTARAA
jgi:putative membrane protein (TIGR04086 family)